jgi:hypothetical protein
LPCLANGALQRGGIKVMAKLLTTSWVYGAPGGREEILPDQLSGGVGVLYSQGIRNGDFAVTGRQVFLMEQADAFDLTA